MPLLHHPLTVESQGGAPLSAGPAALIWADNKVVVGVPGACWGQQGIRVVGVGERRGWTHSLLLIKDQYTD